MRYPGRLVNNLLQAKLEGAGRGDRRAINSTIGILGLFDAAKSIWGIAV
jgi:ABC-type transporter lipoprotein component MlaA